MSIDAADDFLATMTNEPVAASAGRHREVDGAKLRYLLKEHPGKVHEFLTEVERDGQYAQYQDLADVATISRDDRELLDAMTDRRMGTQRQRPEPGQSMDDHIDFG